MKSAATTNTNNVNSMETLESIYIPRIYGNIKPEFITYTFEHMGIGTVERIETFKRQVNDNTYMAFVYFSYWNVNNPAAINLAKRINDHDSQARIVYDDPWYWILLPNKSDVAKSTTKQKNIHSEEATRVSSGSVSPPGETLNGEEEISILKSMVENLQERLLSSEQNYIMLQKQVVDLRTILLTGGIPDDLNVNWKEINSRKENNYYPPLHPPKLIRQNAVSPPPYHKSKKTDNECGSFDLKQFMSEIEAKYPSSSNTPIQTSTTTTAVSSSRLDEMGLVYPDSDTSFWCDP